MAKAGTTEKTVRLISRPALVGSQEIYQPVYDSEPLEYRKVAAPFTLMTAGRIVERNFAHSNLSRCMGHNVRILGIGFLLHNVSPRQLKEFFQYGKCKIVNRDKVWFDGPIELLAGFKCAMPVDAKVGEFTLAITPPPQFIPRRKDGARFYATLDVAMQRKAAAA